MGINRKDHIAVSGEPHQVLYDCLQANLTGKSWPKVDAEKANTILTRLKSGFYHDFLTDTITPKVTMVEDLQEIEWVDVADLVIDGVFDEKPDTDWKNSPT